MILIGERLKEKRKSKQLNQTQTAKLLNISQGTYAGYETNKHNPDIETLAKIADIFETSMDYLAGRYNQNNP